MDINKIAIVLINKRLSASSNDSNKNRSAVAQLAPTLGQCHLSKKMDAQANEGLPSKGKASVFPDLNKFELFAFCLVLTIATSIDSNTMKIVVSSQLR